jgi:CHAT domain-containing protein
MRNLLFFFFFLSINYFFGQNNTDIQSSSENENYTYCQTLIDKSISEAEAEKYEQAFNTINQLLKYLEELRNESTVKDYFMLYAHLKSALFCLEKGKDISIQKEFLSKNYKILDKVRLINPKQYSDFILNYAIIFECIDPLIKTLFNEAKSFFENHLSKSSYENLYFGIYYSEYLVCINNNENALEISKKNIEYAKSESFFDLIEKYNSLIRKIYLAQGNILEYAKHSDFDRVREKDSGQRIRITSNSASILELLILKFSSKERRKKYVEFLLSKNKILFDLEEYNYEWRKVTKRDIAFLFGRNNEYYSQSLKDFAYFYYRVEEYKKAIRKAFRSYEIEQKIFLSESQDIFRSKEELIPFLLLKNDFDKLDTLFKSVAKYKVLTLNKSFFTFNPKELIYQKQNSEGFYNYFLNYSWKKNNFKGDIYYLNKLWRALNGISNSKSKWLQQEIKENKTFENEVIKIKELQKQLNYSELDNYSTIQRNKIISDSLNKIQEQIELKLIQNQTFNSLLKGNKNEINFDYFIDFSSITKFNFYTNQWTDSTQYLVFISDSKDSLVDYVFIEDGTKIDQDLFDQYKKEATDPEQKTDLKSEKFYNYFWKPIADKIGDAKTIYVSLGGVYNNINLNSIYNPTTGKYLIEDKDIRIVNSARDFVLNKENEKKNYTTNTASLFGFPNFDGNTTVSADTFDLFTSTRDLNSFWLDSLTRGGMKAKPLPATKTEVENISSTLKSKGWQVNSFLADNASETNIKKQQSPRILHVATHGYFFQDIPMEKDNNRFLGMDREQVLQDPMLRSGLLLTGANKTLKGETISGENGLLSAAEASLLDLGETELVVLSACETGKGEVKNSEGVYGLRKAFSDAGAQNIIMSLWKVDDKVTQEFMSSFYEIWLNDKMSIREAFNKTQLEIKAKYPQPYYWGAFILVGE